LYDFGLFLNPGSELSKWDILKGNLVSTIPELLIGYAILPFMIGGLILYFVREKRLNLLMAILVFLCLLGFHLLELGQMKHHSYYMLPYLPFAAFLTAYAFHRLKKNMLIPGILIILIQMPLTKLRIDHRFTDKHAGIPTEFQKNAQLDSLRSNLDPNALSLVGPDPSGCIFLYYLQLKGYNAFGLSQIRDETEIAHALDSGIIEQIVLRSENPEYALPAFYVKEQQIGAFCIYRKSFQ
jgi:hypothetical protein